MAQKHNRKLHILNILRENSYTTSDQLAGILGVSDKTAMAQVRLVSREGEKNGFRIESKRGYGYTLKITDEQHFQTYMQGKMAEQKGLDQTLEERVYYVALLILNQESYIKWDEVCDRLYISKSTLNLIMRQVKKLYLQYGLTIHGKPYYGVKVEGGELDCRRCFACCLQNCRTYADLIFTPEDKVAVEEALSKAFVNASFDLTEISRTSLVEYLMIAVVRIRQNRWLTGKAKDPDQLDTEYGELARKIAVGLENRFSILFSEAEIDYIAVQLSCKQKLKRFGTHNMVLNGQTQDLAMDMINRIAELFQIDFSADLELKVNLCSHLVPLLNRLAYNFWDENPLKMDIRREYPFAYEMATVAVSVIYEQYRKKVNEDEISYLATIFALALERRKKQKKKNVLLVCDHGQGTTELLKLRLEEEFKDTIGRIRSCTSGELEGINYLNIDYVFTTVEIQNQIPVPILELSPLLTRADMKELKRRLQQNKELRLDRYFCKDLFLPSICLESKEQVLKQMCDQIVALGYDSADLFDRVMEREKYGQTTYSHCVAIPHPIRRQADRHYVCVGILEKPILWDKQEIGLVFLFSLAKSADLDAFYKAMGEVLTSPNLVREPTGMKNYDDFIKYIENLLKQSEE